MPGNIDNRGCVEIAPPIQDITPRTHMAKLAEHLERLRAMCAPNQRTWDLSPNDVAAIRWAVERLESEDGEEPVGHIAGDVFQINEKHGRTGWVGALVLATEVKGWGVMGFVAHVVSHDEQARAYIRLPFDQIDYIGHAPLIPADEVPAEAKDS
jgi:hypothetical protein